MKNKKLMFSEARFVFGKLGESLNKSIDSLSGVAETSTKAPASTETSAQKAKRLKKQKETMKKLSAVKLNIVENSLITGKLDLGGKVFEVPFEKINSKQMVAELSAELLPVLNLKSNASFFNGIHEMSKVYNIDIKLEEVKELVARVYAGTMLHKAKLTSSIYSSIPKYAKAMKMKDTGVKAKISLDASGKIKVEFTSKDPNFFKKYWKWETEKGSKNKTKAKPKESISKPELDRFAKSPLGKIFKFLRVESVKKGEKGKTWLELIQEGKAPPLALFIAGLFGYKIGAEMYGGAIDMLPDKFKGRLKKFERRARNSRYSAKSYAKKSPRKTSEVGKGAESVNAKYFADAIKYNSIPKKGIKLSEDYSFKKGETLVVDLAGGGQVVLPKGKDKAYVNGELADPGKVYKNVKITFSNTIPKGTVMTGKVDLKKIVPKKA